MDVAVDKIFFFFFSFLCVFCTYYCVLEKINTLTRNYKLLNQIGETKQTSASGIVTTKFILYSSTINSSYFDAKQYGSPQESKQRKSVTHSVVIPIL